MIDLLQQTAPPAYIDGDFWQDMQLGGFADQAFEDDARGRELFLGFARKPLAGGEAIRERQAVLADFVGNPGLIASLLAVCGEAEDMPLLSRNHMYEVLEPSRRLAHNQKACKHIIGVLQRAVRAIRAANFTARPLRDLQQNWRVTQQLETMARRLDEVCGLPRAQVLRVSFGLTPQLKLHSVRMIAAAGADRKQRKGNQLASPVARKKHEMVEQLMLYATSLCAAIYAQIRDWLKELQAQVEGVQAMLAAQAYLAQQGAVCLPQIDGEGLWAEGLWDALQADELGAGAIDLVQVNQLWVFGQRHMQKVSLLRRIGLAQLLCQMGLQVPAAAYTACAFPTLVSHFPRHEDDTQRYGKLVEELTRLRAFAPRIQGGGLVLMSESFATTTIPEGSALAFDVLTAMAHTRARVVFSTYFQSLRERVDEARQAVPCREIVAIDG